MAGGNGWEPTTAAEVALFEALVGGDQERYFIALGRSELLLPVSADALAGRAPMGWATWTSNDHTHLLAFTSVESMRTCLAEHAGGARRMPFGELAKAWPNQDWWLAINPGLPIEGYLPAWFVTQLGRGDARLPGQVKSGPRDRLARVEAMERAKAARAAAQQAPRDLREPVRVSASVAPRALSSSPLPPLVAPRPDTQPWLQPPTPPATPWRSDDERTTLLQPGSPLPRHDIEGEAVVHPPAAPPPPPVDQSWRAESDARVAAWRTEDERTAVLQQQSSGFMPASSLPRRDAGERTVVPPPSASRVAEPEERTVLMRPHEPAKAWTEPASASASWAEPAATHGWQESTVSTNNGHDPIRPRHAEPDPDFIPANQVEEELYEAAESGNTDAFLGTLLLATIMVPKASGMTNGKLRPQPIDGEPHIVCYTSTQHIPEPLEMVSFKFLNLIREWPDPNWSFAVNPGTPVGATLPGGQLMALASWAAEVGLGREEEEVGQESTERGSSAAGRASAELTVLQKAVAPSQVSYYLDRGYDRVSGFVHRAHEVAHLRNPEQMRRGLGLDYEGSPFGLDASEVYLLRWSAYRPNLYRIPYGGQNEAGMKAMEGWVIERAPFRGNGFAPGEGKEIIAEFKVDSARLPHGTRLMRLDLEGREYMIAILDIDGQRWLRTDGK